MEQNNIKSFIRANMTKRATTKRARRILEQQGIKLQPMTINYFIRDRTKQCAYGPQIIAAYLQAIREREESEHKSASEIKRINAAKEAKALAAAN